MALETRISDPAAYLDNEEALASYMSDALETKEPAVIADALGVVARARGMSEVARDRGLPRESLYRALSREGGPEFSTILPIVRALGLRLAVRPAAS